MIEIVRTNSDSPDFIELVKQLDADLTVRDGNDHTFYSQFNKIDRIKHALVVYEDEVPVACGALREFSPGIMEVKRMYTVPPARGRGMAAIVLAQLEKWALELLCEKCILETGYKQPEALSLYEKSGYARIPNYGPYEGIGNSVCFEKLIK